MFFVISRFLFFLKCYSTEPLQNKPDNKKIKHFIKRSAILYIVWLIIDFFYVVYRKPYIQLGFVDAISEFIKDIFLGSTFPGSWFISALVVSVVLVFYMSKYINPNLIFIVSLIISVYTLYPEIFPARTILVYKWYETHIRPEMNLSFPFALVWISMGQLMALWYNRITSKSNIYISISLIMILLSYIIDIVFNNSLTPLFTRYLSTASIFTFFLLIRLEDRSIYKRLRNYSILIFLFHFSIAGKKSMFLSYVGDTLAMHWLYYILVVFVSLLFAQIVLFLEKKKKIVVLKIFTLET